LVVLDAVVVENDVVVILVLSYFVLRVEWIGVAMVFVQIAHSTAMCGAFNDVVLCVGAFMALKNVGMFVSVDVAMIIESLTRLGSLNISVDQTSVLRFV